MGPITTTLLGLLLLAIIVSVICIVGKKFGFMDAQLAQGVIWVTLAVIGVAGLILILRMLGFEMPRGALP